MTDSSSSSGKYAGFGFRTRPGTERSTIIADVFNVIQKVPDIGIHQKVDKE